jgi:D-hydroxyproline dehydrogenase subunit alpha
VPDLVIVGAGPAGLAAAVRAGELGLSVLVADENVTAGGQYYRQQPEPFSRSGSSDPQQERGRRLIESARQVATLRLATSVWGIGQGSLWLDHGSQPEQVAAPCTLLATGAYDRPTPFPGWTLPGVISAGAAQTLVKGQALRPGSRALVAGSGPFLLTVAAHLVKAGVTVTELVEATTVRESLGLLPRTAAYPGRYLELVGYLAPLAAARVHLRQGYVVAAAEGDRRLERVRLEPRRGRSGQARTVEADLLCVGYGFSASTELARLAGCELRWDRGLAQPVPGYDDWQATSVAGLFVAGEACGFGGAQVAELEGQVAAIGAARYLGRLSDADAARLADPLRRNLRRARRFGDLLTRTFPAQRRLLDMVSDETLICRCQNVSFGPIARAVQDGARDLNEIKTSTRCGMGWCQGRICGAILPTLLHERVDPAFDVSTPFTTRLPLRPVRVSAMARAASIPPAS